jgi:hypothetical protein
MVYAKKKKGRCLILFVKRRKVRCAQKERKEDASYYLLKEERCTQKESKGK